MLLLPIWLSPITQIKMVQQSNHAHATIFVDGASSRACKCCLVFYIEFGWYLNWHARKRHQQLIAPIECCCTETSYMRCVHLDNMSVRTARLVADTGTCCYGNIWRVFVREDWRISPLPDPSSRFLCLRFLFVLFVRAQQPSRRHRRRTKIKYILMEFCALFCSYFCFCFWPCRAVLFPIDVCSVAKFRI